MPLELVASDEAIISFQATRKSPSIEPVLRRSRSTGRTEKASTRAIGAPEASAMATATVESFLRVKRTRREDGPTARTETPLQENGSATSSSETRASACSAASKSAGWIAKRIPSAAAASGSATSAKSSASRVNTARSPWKAGP